MRTNVWRGGRAMLIFLEAIENEDDRTRVRQLYEKYVGIMRSRAYKILKNRQDADDAVQNTFIKIIDYLDRLPDLTEKQEKFYMVSAVENTAIDLYRKKQREKETELDEAILEVEQWKPYEGENEVVKEILSLSIRDRQIIFLRYIYGYKNAEIGDLLGMTEEAVKKAARRAEKRLRKKCEEDGLL